MDESLVQKAVGALQKYNEVARSKGKSQLIEENQLVSLIIALKKIPNSSVRPHRIPLCHTLYPPEDTELCLFTKTGKEQTRKLLEDKHVKGVAKIITLEKLRTKYNTFESKRQLSSTYDVFLTDKRLYHLLPQRLGKKFFQKKKFPYPVDMRKKDLAKEIQTARDSTYLHLGLGSCCAVPIARIGFPTRHIVENIAHGMRGVASKIPRGWRNIQSVHLKTVDSIALPLYNSLPPQATLLPAVDGPRGKKRRVEHLASSDGEDPGDLEPNDSRGSAEVTGSGDAVVTPPAKKVKLPSRMSAKKIKGSTVVSSKYEKALKRRRTAKF